MSNSERIASMSTDTLLSAEQLAALRNDTTLGCGNLIDKVLARHESPGRPFLFLQQPIRLPNGSVYQEMSIQDLADARKALARWYLSLGVGLNDIVAVCVSDGIAPFLHYSALSSLGAVASVINPKMSAAMAPQYLSINGFFTVVIDEGTAETSSVAHYVLQGGDSRFRVYNASARNPPEMEPVDDLPAWWPRAPSDNTLVMLSHTSGTTGVSKAVKFEHRQFFMAKRDRLGRFLDSADERFLCALPPSHSSAISHIETAVLHGVPTYLVSDCSGRSVKEAIAHFKPTVVAAFPQSYVGLARSELRADELKCVRRWFSMGDAMHGAHIKRILTASPRSRFLDCFGSSELGMAVFQSQSTIDRIAPSRCVGRPVGVAICKVIESSTGSECGDSQVGLLTVRSPTITAGYWKQDERTAASWKGGDFLTGDIGFVKDGQYYLIDRTADVLRLNGRDFHTLLIEEHLQTLPEVFDAIVVGSESGGQPLVCVLVLASETLSNPAQLLTRVIAEVRFNLMASQESNVIVFAAITTDSSSIPTGPTGKVLKRQLAPLLAGWVSGRMDDEIAKSFLSVRLDAPLELA